MNVAHTPLTGQRVCACLGVGARRVRVLEQQQQAQAVFSGWRGRLRSVVGNKKFELLMGSVCQGAGARCNALG